MYDVFMFSTDQLTTSCNSSDIALLELISGTIFNVHEGDSPVWICSTKDPKASCSTVVTVVLGDPSVFRRPQQSTEHSSYSESPRLTAAQWSKIKHRKGLEDAKKSKVYGKAGRVSTDYTLLYLRGAHPCASVGDCICGKRSGSSRLVVIELLH